MTRHTETEIVEHRNTNGDSYARPQYRGIVYHLRIDVSKMVNFSSKFSDIPDAILWGCRRKEFSQRQKAVLV